MVPPRRSVGAIPCKVVAAMISECLVATVVIMVCVVVRRLRVRDSAVGQARKGAGTLGCGAVGCCELLDAGVLWCSAARRGPMQRGAA